MAGDVADGLIGHPMCPPRWLDEVMVPNLEAGLARSGRERSDIDFIPTVCCAIDDDEARALDAARRTIAFYSTVRTYEPLWEMHGFARRGGGGRRRVPQGRPRRGARRRSPTRWSTRTPPPGRWTRSAPGWRRSAERGDGVLLTPPTYFIPPEQIGEYQREIDRGVRPGLNGSR